MFITSNTCIQDVPQLKQKQIRFPLGEKKRLPDPDYCLSSSMEMEAHANIISFYSRYRERKKGLLL